MRAVYLIRHGQASFGAADYDALSPLGVEQARVTGVALSHRLPACEALRAYCGDLRRQRDTAAHCLAALDYPRDAEVHSGFNEYDHEDVIGAHEPRYRDRGTMQAELRAASDPRAAFQRMFEAAIHRWTGGAHDADYAESWPMFGARCAAALEHVVERVPEQGAALVFTSGGTITALLQRLLGLSLDSAFRLNWSLANAGITRLVLSERGARVMSINEHGHLHGRDTHWLSFR